MPIRQAEVMNATLSFLTCNADTDASYPGVDICDFLFLNSDFADSDFCINIFPCTVHTSPCMLFCISGEYITYP